MSVSEESTANEIIRLILDAIKNYPVSNSQKILNSTDTPEIWAAISTQNDTFKRGSTIMAALSIINAMRTREQSESNLITIGLSAAKKNEKFFSAPTQTLIRFSLNDKKTTTAKYDKSSLKRKLSPKKT